MWPENYKNREHVNVNDMVMALLHSIMCPSRGIVNTDNVEPNKDL